MKNTNIPATVNIINADIPSFSWNQMSWFIIMSTKWCLIDSKILLHLKATYFSDTAISLVTQTSKTYIASSYPNKADLWFIFMLLEDYIILIMLELFYLLDNQLSSQLHGYHTVFPLIWGHLSPKAILHRSYYIY